MAHPFARPASRATLWLEGRGFRSAVPACPLRERERTGPRALLRTAAPGVRATAATPAEAG